MTPLIEKVKQVGIDCLKSIKESLHFNTFRVAFIGYRDFDCIPEEQSVVIDFTDDIESFVAKVSAVKCFGGRDQAEDGEGLTTVSVSAYITLRCRSSLHGN